METGTGKWISEICNKLMGHGDNSISPKIFHTLINCISDISV